MVTIDFNDLDKKDTSQNSFFYVLQKKESLTVLQR